MFKLFRSKRGFELQFNWLFVLIGGAIILGFFFLVLRNQLDSSDVEDAQAVQQDIDLIFRGTQGSRSGEKIVPVGGRIDFSCDSGVSQYIIRGSQTAFQYNYLAVFSPPFLDGSELLINTESFDAPFHVMPFAYVTNRNVQYIAAGNSPETVAAFRALPENSTRMYLSGALQDLPDDHYDMVIFITDPDTFISQFQPARLSGFQPSRFGAVRAVVIQPEGGIGNYYGRVYFYNYTDTGFQKSFDSIYFSGAQSVGAAFSGDGQIYQCQLDKSVRRLGLVASMHRARVAKLLSYTTLSEECLFEYGELSGNLDNLADRAKGQVTLNDLPEIFEAIGSISGVNQALVRATGCPPIY